MKNYAKLQRNAKNPELLSIRALIIPIIFFVVFGILLITVKNALTIAAYVFAILLICVGLYEGLLYFRSTPIRRITEARLALALACVLSGILLAFNPDYVNDLLPILWGLSLLFGSFLKVQYSIDEKMLGVARWWIMLIMAGVSVLLGILALLRPDFLGDRKETIIGIMLLVETALDVAVYFLLNSALKKRLPSSVTVPVAEPAPAPAPDPAPAPTQTPASAPEA